MIARLIAVAIVLLLALYAFVGDALGAGQVANPFGIMFLALAVLVWYGWRPIHDGFVSAKRESDLPVIRLSAKMIRGMTSPNEPLPRRSPV
jgi:hypothetical protein